MPETKEVLNVYQKLQGCRVLLAKSNLKKSGKNTFANFDYFELSDFLPKVNELFDGCKLCSRFFIVDESAYLDIINAEKPEEVMTFTSPIAEANLKGCTPIQSLGGVHSYMKRYLYLNALEISDGDLFDAVSGSDKVEAKPAAKTAPKPNAKSFTPVAQETLAECFDLGVDIGNIAKYLKKSVEELSDDEVKACLAKKRQGK